MTDGQPPPTVGGAAPGPQKAQASVGQVGKASDILRTEPLMSPASRTPSSLPPMVRGHEQHSGAAPGQQLDRVSVGQVGNLRTVTLMSPASGPYQPRPPMASRSKGSAPRHSSPILPPIQQKMVQADDGGQNLETETRRFQFRKSTRQLTGIKAVLAACIERPQIKKKSSRKDYPSSVPSGVPRVDNSRGRSKPEQSLLSGQDTVDQTDVRIKMKYD